MLHPLPKSKGTEFDELPEQEQGHFDARRAGNGFGQLRGFCLHLLLLLHPGW